MVGIYEYYLTLVIVIGDDDDDTVEDDHENKVKRLVRCRKSSTKALNLTIEDFADYNGLYFRIPESI